MKKIRTLYCENKPLFSGSKMLEEYIDYNTNWELYDMFFVQEYGDMYFLGKGNVSKSLDVILLVHESELKGLKELYSIVYNPINNYDMTEIEYTNGVDSGNKTAINNGTEKKESEGENNNVVNAGGSSTKNLSFGAKEVRSSSNRIPATVENTSEKSVIPYDTNTYKNIEKNINTEVVLMGEEINSNNLETEREDSENVVYNDTNETKSAESSRVNVVTSIDSSETTSSNRNIERRLTRSGNIGVTTTQQMIEAEKRKLNFSMFKEIVARFVSCYCAYLWS